MVTVAEELPFVAVVRDEKIDDVCSNCFANKYPLSQVNLKRCAGCNIIHYCSKKCQVEDWKAHKAECNGPMLVLYGDDDVRMMIRLLSRVKRGDLPVAFNGRTFDDLMDHKDEVRKDEVRKFINNDMSDLYEKLVAFIGRKNVPNLDEFIPLYGKCLTNSFDITYVGAFGETQFLGAGLYLGLSAHDHSCRPNAEFIFNGSKMVLRALDSNVKYSKDLTIPYIVLTQPKEDRQIALRYKYYFDCECERCLDKDSELLERSGKSKCCPTDGAVLPVDNNKPLTCTKCGKKSALTLEQINDANNKLAKMWDEEVDNQDDSMGATREYRKLARLLESMESILSPYNLYLLKFTQLVMNASSVMDKITTTEPKYYLAAKNASEKYSRVNAMDNLIYALVTAKAASTAKAAGTRSYNPHRNGNNPRKNALVKRGEMALKKALAAVKEVYGSDHPLYQETKQFSLIGNGQIPMTTFGF